MSREHKNIDLNCLRNFHLACEYIQGRGCPLLVEFIYLAFTCMPGERHRRQFRSLLFCLCDFLRVPINSHYLLILRKKTKTVLNSIWLKAQA